MMYKMETQNVFIFCDTTIEIDELGQKKPFPTTYIYIYIYIYVYIYIYICICVYIHTIYTV